MKKLITVLLSLIICAGCFGAAAENEPVTEDMPVAGLSFTYPQAFIDAQGCISTDGAMNLFGSVYFAYWYYIAASEEEITSLLQDNPEELSNRASLLFYVFSVGEGKDFAAVCSQAKEMGVDFDAENAVKIGQADSWEFYLYMNPDPEFTASTEKEYSDEYAALMNRKDEIASAFTFYVPFNEYGEMDGKVVRFEATDLEGNPVSSEEIFAKHAITMVNIWATWCPPCVGELGELQAIHTRFLENDCAVLGLMIDQDTEEANRLIAENGIDYQVVLASDTFGSFFPYSVVPTTFFVDRSGAFLGTKIQEANPEMYETAIQPLLEQVQKANP